MTLEVRSTQQQVQAASQEQQLSTWGRLKTTVSSSAGYVRSNWKWFAGGTVVTGAAAIAAVTIGPGVALGGLATVIGELFRRTAVDAFVEVSDRTNETAENVGMRALETAEDITVRAMETVDRNMDKTVAFGDRTVDKTLTFGETTRDKMLKVAEITIGVGLTTLVTYTLALSECPDNNVFCEIVRPLATMIGLGGGLFLIVRNMLPHRMGRQSTVHSQFLQIAHSSAITNIPRAISAHPNGVTTLMAAAFKGDVDVIRQLQRQGVDLDARDASGMTALHHAAMGTQQQAFEWLWYFGCDMNVQDYINNLSPIHYIQSAPAFFQQAKKLSQTMNRFKLGSELGRPLYSFYPPEAFAYKGGGPKGIAYVGVQKFLEKQDALRDLRRISGTSAGAINATLVALGYSGKEMEQVLVKTDLKDFLDHPFQTERELMYEIGEIAKQGGDTTFNELYSTLEKGIKWWFSKGKKGRPVDLFKKACNRGGLCSGKKFLKWIEHLICEKTKVKNCTFREFRELMGEKNFKHLHLYVTDIKTNLPVCINSEDSKWDDVIVADAVRASMSIPMVFETCTLRKKDKYGRIRADATLGEFVDGGLIKNLPIDRFDFERYRSTNPRSNKGEPNYQTMAFNLVDPVSDPQPVEESEAPTNIFGAAVATVKVLATAEDILTEQNRDHQARIINIDNCGMGLLSGFFADQAKKQELMESGYECTEAFYLEQEELAEQYADHNPQKILTIFSQPAVRVMPEIRASTVQIEEVQDQQDSVQLRMHASMADLDDKEFVTIQQGAMLSTTSTERMIRQSDGAGSKVVGSEQVIELHEQITTTVRRRETRLQRMDEDLQQIDVAYQQIEALRRQIHSTTNKT